MSANDEFIEALVKIFSKVSKVFLGVDACFKSSNIAGETIFYPIEVAYAYLSSEDIPQIQIAER